MLTEKLLIYAGEAWVWMIYPAAIPNTMAINMYNVNLPEEPFMENFLLRKSL
jgi:hypothetical protein